MSDDQPTRAALVRLRDVLRRPWVSVLTAVAVVLALAGLSRLPTPVVPSTAAPVEEQVASTELVCAATAATSALVSTISAGVAPVPSVVDGGAALSSLTSSSTAPAPLQVTAPGATVTRTVTGAPGPAQLARAVGSFATGFGADQTSRSGQDSTRGLAAAPCARPVADGWYIGGGSTVGRITQVILVNDDDRPAQVDLLVYGPAGRVQAPAGSGIVLAPMSRLQVRLDSLAPNQTVTALHLLARTGRVAALVLDQAMRGLVPLGMALESVTQPGRRVVIPSVPSGLVQASLVLVSPDADTTATVRFLTSGGPITPAGLDQVDLVAGHVRTIHLTGLLATEAVSVVVSADSDVVAGVNVVAGSATAQLTEMDGLAATAPLTGQGLVVGLAAGKLRNTVTVAAPDVAGSATLALYVPDRTEPVWTSTVEVPAGSLRRVAVPVTTATPTSFLVITPVSGQVYVSRDVTEAGARGPMLAMAPVGTLRSSTLVPPVVAAPGSALG